MKGTLFIAAITILCCLPASSLHAKKKIITLTEHFTTDNKIKWDEEERSLIGNIPFILHNQNIFYIYSGVLLEEAKLTIKDKYNHIVYTTIETMLPHEENVFILNIEKGNYTRVFLNGQPVPFQGLCSVKFQGFGAECGSTKYFFRVNL